MAATMATVDSSAANAMMMRSNATTAGAQRKGSWKDHLGSEQPGHVHVTASNANQANSNNNNNNNNNSASPPGALTISSKPTLITTPHLRFLIMDAPRQSNLHLYIKECRRNHVTDVVRVCEPTYLGSELQKAGIQLHEMAYEDGHSPPEEVLNRWLRLVEDRFFGGGGSGGNADAAQNTIAVHCVAGLGRAPVLVAIALVEFEKMDPVEAVMMIRRNRRGAINEKQLQYLEGYKRRSGGGGGCACIIL